MNFDTDSYYHEKEWIVIKSKYFYVWNNRMGKPWERYTTIKENLNYFEANKFAKVLNKLHGK